MNLAINYGGRDEIVRAVNRWLASRQNGHAGRRALALRPRAAPGPSGAAAPDLIIRTGGEQRLSNFLLWESAYAELFFSPVRWPDWGSEQFLAAIGDYQQRKRTFGGNR